jgi:hypothetical protein
MRLSSFFAAMVAMQCCVAQAPQSPPVINDAVEPLGGCLNYDDSSVNLSGTAFSRIYFGPPGYGEKPESDARERGLLLLLDAPVCLRQSAHPERDNDSYEGNVVLVQLAAVRISPGALWKADGHRVSVRGSLYHALTAHHRTAVLMDVHDLELQVP